MEKKYIHRKNTPTPAAKQRKGTLACPALLLFFALLYGFSLLNLFWPQRELSELENRKLAQAPAFSVKTLLNGEWGKAFASYWQDQIALRDGWIDLESAFNQLVLQKVEENGILLGSDHWMFTKQFTVTQDTAAQLQKNLDAVTGFAARYPGRVTFLLAPSAAVIYPENLPLAAPMIDENAMLDGIFATVAPYAEVVDLREVYTERRAESLYFKTDHHWTTNGAFRAYEQFCLQKGLIPFDRSAHQAEQVTGFYGTHYSATRRWDAVAETITWYPLGNPMTIFQLTGEAQYTPVSTETMVNTEKFATRDKYGAFLDGNNGYSVIEGDGKGSILVVKDSYANSFVPYLTANYAKIGVVDFRSFAYGLDSTIEQEGYDEILIVYNFQTFIADTKVIYINRPTTIQAGE